MQRIVDALAALPAGDDPAHRRYRPNRDDLLYALGIFLIDVGLVIPIVLPLALIADVETAIYASRLIATVIFAALGWAYAPAAQSQPMARCRDSGRARLRLVYRRLRARQLTAVSFAASARRAPPSAPSRSVPRR